MKERRKTINGDDIIWSLGTLGFEEYVEALKIYLKNYREVSFRPPPLSSSSCLLGIHYIMCSTAKAQCACLGCLI